jgi:hypothetical protein
MLTLNLPRTLLAWHATAAAQVDAIRVQGLRRMGKGVYIALHPGVALGYGRAFIADGALLAIVVPRSLVRWGGDLRLDRREGAFWSDLPPSCLVGVAPFAACSAIPSCWPAHDGIGFHPILHPGFAPWLEDGTVADHLHACLDAAEADPTTALLATLYAQGLDVPRHAIIAARIPAALVRILHEARTLPLDQAVCALEMLRTYGRGWCPERPLLDRWPLPVLALWAAADRGGRLSLANRCAAEQAAQVLAVGEGRASGPLDVPQTEALVALIRYGRWGQQRCRPCLDALAALPEPLAEQALLALLADLRRLPVKAREHLFRLLAPRAPRLTRALQDLAATAPWLTARMARRLLDRSAVATAGEEDTDG